MNLASIQAAESKLLLQTYERNPYLFVSGQGVYLQDADGNDYLDLLSGIGVSALGYAHPAVEEAIRGQSKRLIHTSNLFFHEHTAELALRLTEISGLDRVFLYQQRHRGLGSRSQTRARQCRPPALQRTQHRH